MSYKHCRPFHPQRACTYVRTYLVFLVFLLLPVHQPPGVGAEDTSEVIQKIVDLPEAAEPSSSTPVSQDLFMDEEDLIIDFPQKLPAGVRVDDKGNMYANNTLLFTKNVRVTASAGVLYDDVRVYTQ